MARGNQGPSATARPTTTTKSPTTASNPTTTTKTTKKTTTRRQVTPLAPPKPQRIAVDKNIVDELLLVCSVIGSHDETTGQFVPVTDCLAWLQDLQRALRRDDDLTRPICALVGDWRVVEQKLLPLVLACRYNVPLVLTVCKILVILTKPLSTATARAAVLPIDTKSKKAHPK